MHIRHVSKIVNTVFSVSPADPPTTDEVVTVSATTGRVMTTPRPLATGTAVLVVHFNLVQPLNNYHFVEPAILPFIERLSSLRRLKCTSILEKGPQSVSFCRKVFLLRPLFGVSFI